MDLHLEQQQIPCLILCAHRSTEERFSADFVVPDSLPDAADLLLTEGELCLWRLDLSDGSAELEGEISARICFADEHGTPTGFPVSVPVSLRMRAEAIETGQKPFLRCCVTTLNAHLLNSRKVRIQALLHCSLSTYRASDVTVTTGLSSENQKLFSRTETVCVPFVSAVEEQVFTAEETLPLRLGIPKDGRLISYGSVPIADVCECADQRVILKGKVRTEVLYQDAEKQELVSEFIETPFSCLMDVNGEVSMCRLSLHLTNEEICCRNDEPAVDTAFHLVAQAVCYAEQEVECLTDAYCNRAQLMLNWETLELPRFEYLEEQNVLEDDVPCEISGQSISAARAAQHGEGFAITVLLRDSEQKISSVTSALKTELNLDGLVWTEQPMLKQCDTGLTVRLPVFTHPESEETFALRVLTEAKLDEEIKTVTSGVTLLKREGTDDLWELAKRNASSIQAIKAANPDREQESSWIVIPHVK